MNKAWRYKRIDQATLAFSVLFAIIPMSAQAKELSYGCSQPPLEVTFAVVGGHYNGKVNCGNLFLQPDIPTAPLVRWKGAKARKFYTLMMLDLDANCNGSYPDLVSPGDRATFRHWVVGNIPGDLLRSTGYIESATALKRTKVRVLQPYYAPSIPVVSDRYGLYLFEQRNEIAFAPVSTSMRKFDYSSLIDAYKLGDPKASNYFVAIYTSESPFSGKAFHGNDVSQVWHQGYGKGKLPPSQ